MPFSLFNRKGTWYVKITVDGRVQWKSTGSKDRAAARQFLSNLKKQHSVNCKPVPVNKSLSQSPNSLHSFSQEYLHWSQRNHRPATTRAAELALRTLAKWCGNVELEQVTAHRIDRYISSRLTSVSPSSVNIELRMLRSAFNQAKRWGMVSEVPINGKQLLKVPSDTVALSESEVERLINALQTPWLLAVVLTAIYTGMRRNELCRLTWSNYDAQRGVLIVHESKAGKARCIPVSDGLKQLLDSLPQTSEHIFTIDGKSPVKGDWLSHSFKRICRKLGLSEKVHFHTLRHTCASLMVRNGVSLFHASKVLGHSSVVVTEKYYAHMGVEDLRGAVNVIGFTYKD